MKKSKKFHVTYRQYVYILRKADALHMNVNAYSRFILFKAN